MLTFEGDARPTDTCPHVPVSQRLFRDLSLLMNFAAARGRRNPIIHGVDCGKWGGEGGVGGWRGGLRLAHFGILTPSSNGPPSPPLPICSSASPPAPSLADSSDPFLGAV